MRERIVGRFNFGRKDGMSFKGLKTRTKQADKNACDINMIVAKAKKGILPLSIDRRAFYGDFSGLNDFQALNNRLIEIHNDFERLPADIRKKFDNSPEKLLEFVDDPKNLKESVDLGLLPKDLIPKVDAEGNTVVQTPVK